MGRNKNARPKRKDDRLREERAKDLAEKRAADLKARDDYFKPILEEVGVLEEEFVQAGWPAEAECPHEHLPGDPRPHTCDCWAGLRVREAEALKLDVKNLKSELTDVSSKLDSALTMLDTLTEMVAHTDRNVTAVGYQVSQNGR